MSEKKPTVELTDAASPNSSSNTAAVTNYVPPTLSQGRKWFMLFLFCLAEGMDSFIGSGLFPAISTVQKDLNIGPTEISWAFAAYAATFAAFLLISGRVADVYSSRKTILNTRTSTSDMQTPHRVVIL